MALNIQEVYRYGTKVIDWAQENLLLVTLYGPLHPRVDLDRLYASRVKEERGLMSVEDVVSHEEQSLRNYIEIKDDENM